MDKLSYLSLAKHVKYLRRCGFYRLDESSPKIFKNLHTVYRRSVLLFFLLYTVQQILKIHEVKNNVDKVMGTMFLLLTYTDCIYKAVVLWKKADHVEGLLDVMKGPIFNKGEKEHRVFLLDTIKNALLMFRIFNHASLFTCFLWVLHPTILHIRGHKIEFNIWLPFDPNTKYYSTAIYVWIQTSWLAYCNTATDILITFSLEQCRTQVTILRFDLENVVQKSKEEAKETSDAYDNILERRFRDMVIHHKEIVKTAAKVQDIFGGAVFYQFLVSGWILCTSAYRMVDMSPATVEFASMVMYIICILIQICLYCYYGNEIFYESCRLTDSAYAVDWIEIPVRLRKTLIIFMERFKKPIQPMAGLIIPLSNSTFVSVRDNVDQVMGTMFLLLTYTDCIYKAIVLWKKADQIDGLLDVMKGPIFNKDEKEHRVFLLDTIKNALLMFRIFNHASVFTCFLWVLHPTIMYIRGNKIEFPIWLPFDPNTRYYSTAIYVWIQTSWLAYSNTAMDILITFSLEQCRTQVTILRFDLENVVQKSKEEAKETSDAYDNIMERRFRDMVIHHKEIVKTAAKVQDIFGGAVFYQFLVSGWILCTSAYRMVDMSPATVEYASMVMYIICILIQICLYCYYGNEIFYESCSLTDSAYAVDWVEIPVRLRKTLIIFMERIKKPIQPMAGLIIPLSNSTFVSILRSSFSFYAFLKNSRN